MSSLSKFIYVYANPLSTFAAAAMGSATVMWQARTGYKDLKGDLNHIKGDLNHIKSNLNHIKGDSNHIKGDLNHIKGDLNHIKDGLDHVKTELHETKLHLEVIDTELGIMNGNILSTLKAAEAAFKGNPAELNKLVARIEECQKSGDKCCWEMRW